MFSEFLQSEIDDIEHQAAFTKEQQAVFDELRKDENKDSVIMKQLGMSRNHYYKVKKIVALKVLKIMARIDDNGKTK